MKKIVLLISSAAILAVGVLVYAGNQTQSLENCPLAGTPECPFLTDCPEMVQQIVI